MKAETRAMIASMAGVILNGSIIREVVDLQARKAWPIRAWNDGGHCSFVNDETEQRVVGAADQLYDIKDRTYIHFMPQDDGSFHGRVHGEACDFAGDISGTRVSLYDYEDRKWRYFDLRIAHAQVA